jgi:hypothetical protein
VRIDGWDCDSVYPQGHYERVVGRVGELEAEVEVLLVEHEAERPPFSASALACLPDMRRWAMEAVEAAKGAKGGEEGGEEQEEEAAAVPAALLREGEFPITKADLACRRDLRQPKAAGAVGAGSAPSSTPATKYSLAGDAQRVFSVDPPGCQDIDDTMSVKVLPNGNWQVGREKS